MKYFYKDIHQECVKTVVLDGFKMHLWNVVGVCWCNCVYELLVFLVFFIVFYTCLCSCHDNIDSVMMFYCTMERYGEKLEETEPADYNPNSTRSEKAAWEGTGTAGCEKCGTSLAATGILEQQVFSNFGEL